MSNFRCFKRRGRDQKLKIGDDGCRVFISGPMSGYDQYNKPLFDLAEDYLKALGCAVFNPACLTCFDEGWDHESIMSVDITALRNCDVILHLPGWERSKGGFEEALEAKELRLQEAYFEYDTTIEFASNPDDPLPDILIIKDNPMDVDIVPINEAQENLFKALRKRREANW